MKLDRPIREAACVADVGVSIEACLRLCSTRPFIALVVFACPFWSSRESVELCRKSVLRLDFFGARLLIWVSLSESNSKDEVVEAELTVRRRCALSGVRDDDGCALVYRGAGRGFKGRLRLSGEFEG